MFHVKHPYDLGHLIPFFSCVLSCGVAHESGQTSDATYRSIRSVNSTVCEVSKPSMSILVKFIIGRVSNNSLLAEEGNDLTDLRFIYSTDQFHCLRRVFETASGLLSFIKQSMKWRFSS